MNNHTTICSGLKMEKKMKDLEVVAFENEKKDYMDRVASWVAQLSE